MYAFTRQRKLITSEKLTPIFNDIEQIYSDHSNKFNEWTQLHNKLAVHAIESGKNNDRNVVIALLAYISEFNDNEQISLIQEYLDQGIGDKHPLWISSVALAYERNGQLVTSIFIFQKYKDEIGPNEFYDKCYENFKNRLKNRLKESKSLSLGSFNGKRYEFRSNGIICVSEEDESPAPPDIDIFGEINFVPAKQASSLILPNKSSISTLGATIEQGKSILGSRRDIRYSANNPSPMTYNDEQETAEIQMPKRLSPFRTTTLPSVTRRNDNDDDDGATEVQPRESFFDHKPITKKEAEFKSVTLNSNFGDDDDAPKPIISKFTSQKSGSFKSKFLDNSFEAEPTEPKPFKSRFEINDENDKIPERKPIISKFSKASDSSSSSGSHKDRFRMLEEATEEQPREIQSRFVSSNDKNNSIMSLPKRQKNPEGSARKPTFNFPDDSDDEENSPVITQKRVLIKSSRDDEIDNDDPNSWSRPIRPQKTTSSFRTSQIQDDEHTLDIPKPFNDEPIQQPKSIMKKRSTVVRESDNNNNNQSQHVQLRFGDEQPVHQQPRRGTPTTKSDKVTPERYNLTLVKSITQKTSIYQDNDGNSFVVKPMPQNFAIVANLQISFSSLFLMPILDFDGLFVTNYMNDGDLSQFMAKLAEIKFSKFQTCFFVVLQLVRILITLEENSVSHGNLTEKSFLVKAPTAVLDGFDDGEDWNNTGFCLAEVDKLKHSDPNSASRDRKFVCDVLYKMAYGTMMKGSEFPVPKRWPADLWNETFQTLLGNSPLHNLAENIKNFLCDSQNCQSLKSMFSRIIISMKS